MVGGKLIFPEDAGWFIPEGERFTLNTFAATNRDTFAFSGVLEGEMYSLAHEYSRFYRCDHGRWLCTEVSATIADMIPYRPPAAAESGLAVLGREGSVWYPGCDIPDERISGAGTGEMGTNKPGYVGSIREIGEDLFVWGAGGQLYRRRNAVWEHDDEGMFRIAPDFPRKRPIDEGAPAWLSAVAAAGNGDWYACGDVSTCRPALFWRPAGEAKWRTLRVDLSSDRFDFMVLRDIYVHAPDDIYLATNLGFLLRGNARDGFRVGTETVLRGTQPVRFSSVASYKGSIYVGGDRVCRLLEGGELEAVVAPPFKSIFRPSLGSTFVGGEVKVCGDCLWVRANGGLTRFDGEKWERIEVPYLYAEDSEHDGG